MKSTVIQKTSLERIKAIHQLSLDYNTRQSKQHSGKILELIRHHIAEIEELRNKGDKHYLIETGDLIILCFELLLDNDQSIDDVLLKCFERYENKLNNLLKASSH